MGQTVKGLHTRGYTHRLVTLFKELQCVQCPVWGKCSSFAWVYPGWTDTTALRKACSYTTLDPYKRESPSWSWPVYLPDALAVRHRVVFNVRAMDSVTWQMLSDLPVSGDKFFTCLYRRARPLWWRVWCGRSKRQKEQKSTSMFF